MSRRTELLVLAALVLAGTAARAALALTTAGVRFDLQSYALVGRWLTDGDPFDVYAQATATGLDRWPYPPGLFPVLALLADVPRHDDVVRLLLTAADALLVVLVHAVLRPRGARTALAGAALVALGPTLVAVTGHHGQLDVAVWLPALAGLLVWQTRHRRAVAAGLLIGVAIAAKTVPVVVLLACLPTARDRREAATVVAAALAVPAVLLLPFLAADPGGVVAALDYRGIPGYGGLSLLAQPSLAELWLTPVPPGLTPVSQALQDLNGVLTAAGLLAATALCVRHRVPAPQAAVLLVTTLLVVGVNVTVAYTAWALVLLVAAGMVRAALLLQAWLLVPTWMAYTARPRGGWSETAVHAVYVPVMLALLGAAAVALALLVRRTVAGSPA